MIEHMVSKNFSLPHTRITKGGSNLPILHSSSQQSLLDKNRVNYLAPVTFNLPMAPQMSNPFFIIEEIQEKDEHCATIEEENTDIQLEPMIKIVSSSVKYKVVSVPPTHLCEPDNIVNVLDNISTYIVMHEAIQEDILEGLFNALLKHIFHCIIVGNLLYLPNEKFSTYFITNGPQLKKVYSILMDLFPRIPKLITPTVVNGIISIFDSPVDFERGLAKTLLNGIYTTFNSKKMMIEERIWFSLDIYRTSTDRIMSAKQLLDMVQTFMHVIPIKEGFKFFREKIYPLFGHIYLPEFYSSLVPICQFFTSKDSMTSVWCVRYLLRHWPKISSQKIIIYFHQLQSLLSLLSISYLTVLGPCILAKLIDGITSVNYRIALAAISFMQDRTFLFAFIRISPLYRVQLIHALKISRQNWNSEVVIRASEILTILTQPSAKQIKQQASSMTPMLVSNQVGFRRGWTMIASMATVRSNKTERNTFLNRVVDQINFVENIV